MTTTIEPQTKTLGEIADSRGRKWAVAVVLNCPSTFSTPRVASRVEGKWVRQPAEQPDLQPRVILSRPDRRVVDEFNATQFLDATAEGRSFFVADYSNPDECTSFPIEETARIAALIRGVVPRSFGEFRVTWQPNDPAVPF
jgi:hypothetical protein